VTTDEIKQGLRRLRIGRSGIVELIGLSLFGVFLAATSAFDSEDMPKLQRYLFWQLALVGGGVIAAGIEPWIARLFPGRPRLFVIAQLIAMTPPITLWVAVQPMILWGGAFRIERLIWGMPSVLTVNVAVIGLAWLARAAFRRASASASAPDGTAPPTIRAIAVEAEDHYLRIRTEAGSELAGRVDALDVLAPMRRARLDLELDLAERAPVSRTYAALGLSEVRPRGLSRHMPQPLRSSPSCRDGRRPQLEVDLVDARIGDDVHPQPRRQGAVLLVLHQVQGAVVDVVHAHDGGGGLGRVHRLGREAGGRRASIALTTGATPTA
jgi:hypothetical protein